MQFAGKPINSTVQWIQFAFISHRQCHQMREKIPNVVTYSRTTLIILLMPPSLHLHVSLFTPYFFLCVSGHVPTSFLPSEISRIIAPIFYWYLYCCETSRVTLSIPYILIVNEKSMTLTAIQSFQNTTTSCGFIKTFLFLWLLIMS